MMKRIAVIFDMDGVLIDSTRFIRVSFDEYFKPHGFSLELLKEKAGITSFRGSSLKAILGMVEEHYGKHFELEDFSKGTGAISFRLMEEAGIGVDPELLKFLANLKENKIALGIGTASLKWRVIEILDRLDLSAFFKVIVSAEDVPEHKPNPHVYQEVARQLKIPPENCIVIEDATDGIEAAQNAGMKGIAFTAYHTDPGIEEAADLTASSFKELNIKKIKNLVKSNYTLKNLRI